MNRIRQIVSILLASFILASCGVFQPAERPEPLRVEFTQWWGDYTILVAQEKGLFEKYGVEVEPVYYEVFSEALPDLAAGDLDIGLFALGDALNVSRHTDVKVIGVYDNGGFNAVVANKNIETIEDLRGKNIGVQLGTTYELFVLEMLKSAGIPSASVNLVDTEPEDVPRRLGQEISAGFTYEPYITEATQAGHRILFSSEQVSGLNPDVIVIRDEVAQKRPDDVRAFLSAWFEAVAYRNANEMESREIIANYFGAGIDDFPPDPSITLLQLEDNKIFFGQINSDKYVPLTQTARTNGDFLIRIGTLNKLPDFNIFLDPSFLE